jgi:outer membrane protein OmpA-like peptidoglycan-associated protein
MLVVSAPAFAQETHLDPTVRGTTGLFMIPTAAVLGPGEFGVAASYSAIAYEPGVSKVETAGLSGGFVFGAMEGLEVFAMLEPRMGVRYDSVAPTTAPRIRNHPFADARWQTGLGDIYVGAKYRFYGEPDAFTGVALVTEIKLPTSNTDNGIGTGKVDFLVGVSASGEFAEQAGLTGFVGGKFRASPDEFDLGNELVYGIGFQVPTRYWISAIAEFNGAVVQGTEQPATGTTPFVSDKSPAVLSGGLRLSHESGIAMDAVYSYNVNQDDPAGVKTSPAGWLAKLSYTNSRREPIVLMGAAPMNLPPFNRPPTLSCRAERTSVRVGESVRLFADVNDPDGDATTVTWNTQAGSINPREGETVTWSSQGVRPGSGPVTARVSDGFGGTADCELTLTVAAPPPPPEPRVLTFSCSEFPSGNTRIDNRCKAILDDVALQLRQNPRATAVITGHSDSAGAADVNSRMSMERADNAETYLVDTHGITGDRIETASAGSSQPVGDNDTAEGRLQNRRIVVVVTSPAQ